MIDRPLRHWRPGWYVRGWRYGDPMDVPTADELAESQADLNEYLAYMIMGEGVQ